MKLIISILLGLSVAASMPVVKADLIPTVRPVVKISMPRVLEVLGQHQESERNTEWPGALILYPIEARLETMMTYLKKSLKEYEQSEKVRIDISALDEDTPDYTDDFLEKMTGGDDE